MKLGFSLDERQVRRAGLDYWEHVDLRVWPGWKEFEAALPSLGEPFFLSTKAETSLWDAPIGAASENLLTRTAHWAAGAVSSWRRGVL